MARPVKGVRTPVKEVKIHQTCTLTVGTVLHIEEIMEQIKSNNKSSVMEMLLQRGLKSYYDEFFG